MYLNVALCTFPSTLWKFKISKKWFQFFYFRVVCLKMWRIFFFSFQNRLFTRFVAKALWRHSFTLWRKTVTQTRLSTRLQRLIYYGPARTGNLAVRGPIIKFGLLSVTLVAPKHMIYLLLSPFLSPFDALPKPLKGLLPEKRTPLHIRPLTTKDWISSDRKVWIGKYIVNNVLGCIQYMYSIWNMNSMKV